MTALKPLENLRVRGVVAERYPLNKICSHPTCKEETADPHHLFPRSEIANYSWFVAVENGGKVGAPFPHVTGMCRAHHDDLEEHRAWVRLEDDVYVWYDRKNDDWKRVGKLNPQPPGAEAKPKRSPFKGEQRRNRKTITLRVPQDEQEDGAGLWDDAIEQAEERFGYKEPRPPYYTILDALNLAILHGPE